MLVTMPWKRGAVPGAGPACVISATRTEIARSRDVPGISVGGLSLRARWAENPGSIGMQIAMDLRHRVSWSLSAWTTEDDLDRFVRSEHHLRVVAPYRAHVMVAATRWRAEQLDVDQAWDEARRRLRP